MHTRRVLLFCTIKVSLYCKPSNNQEPGQIVSPTILYAALLVCPPRWSSFLTGWVCALLPGMGYTKHLHRLVLICPPPRHQLVQKLPSSLLQEGQALSLSEVVNLLQRFPGFWTNIIQNKGTKLGKGQGKPCLCSPSLQSWFSFPAFHSWSLFSLMDTASVADPLPQPTYSSCWPSRVDEWGRAK